MEESGISALEGATWIVAEYLDESGALAAPVADATVIFQSGQVNGNAGCNGFFASYTEDGDQLTISQAGSTMMACEEAIMAQEQAILAALQASASFTVADGQLSIMNADGETVLILTQQSASALSDVVWIAVNYNNGNQAVVGLLEGTEITALFGEDGTLSGSAGCNNYVTGYTTDNGQITIGQAASTMMFCDQPEGVMEQESAYLAALASAATYSVEGQMLWLRTEADEIAVIFQVDTESVAVAAEAASEDPDPIAADSGAPAIAFASVEAQGPTGRVIAPAGVNVRIGPGTQYPIWGAAPLDTQGEIIGRSSDGLWWVASVPDAPDGQGWVAAAYVEASNTEEVPRVACPASARDDGRATGGRAL
ncbi:MAG: META domain-containing protein [Caldilineaceae bacterium]|nr:META domain-containing protein [Caldilineaceae bacterium]